MAWNEPTGGSNKPKDPWGGNNSNQGPPDLDEVLKNLQAKLQGLFGGGSGGGSSSGGSSPAFSGAVVAVLVVLALLVWAVMGVYQVD